MKNNNTITLEKITLNEVVPHRISSHLTFMAELSHEFQTPLAILRGNLELLENEEGIRNRRALRVMATTIERLSRLVSRTLERTCDVARHGPDEEMVSVSILLEEVHDECVPLAEDRRIMFALTDSVPVFLCGNRDELKEVLLNVIANALQHTRAGGLIRLSAKLHNAEVIIEVCDTGCGIAAEDIPHIFDRFYRIGERRAGVLGDIDARGTGLGLAICREIIGAHQGSIDVESELGKGSKFIVRLPVRKVSQNGEGGV